MSSLRKADGTVKIAWTARLEYVDREGTRRIAKGRTFVVEGREIDLFPVGVLCAVLGRSHRAIYKWEESFGFPPALYRVSDDKKCNRWYSRKQISAMRAIYETFGCLRGKNRTKLRTFISAVRKVFYTLDAPVEERDSRNERQVSGMPGGGTGEGPDL